MATVPPYHTNSPEYLPKHREVYHDKDTCPDGKRIKREHWESGTGVCKDEGHHVGVEGLLDEPGRHAEVVAVFY